MIAFLKNFFTKEEQPLVMFANDNCRVFDMVKTKEDMWFNKIQKVESDAYRIANPYKTMDGGLMNFEHYVIEQILLELVAVGQTADRDVVTAMVVNANKHIGYVKHLADSCARMY